MVTKSGRRQGAVCSRWLRLPGCACFSSRPEGKASVRRIRCANASRPGWAMQHACQHSLRAVTGQSEVSLVSGETLRDRVRATYLLQAGRDLRVIQMGVVATLAADELKLACVRVAAGREPRRGDRGADSGRLGRQPLHATLQARRLRLVSLIGPTRAVRSACASWPWRSTSPSPRLAII